MLWKGRVNGVVIFGRGIVERACQPFMGFAYELLLSLLNE
jgi:hypothetical protein